ncbi:MAG: cupin domain-containing protein [Hyphomicrobiales bacterium]|nr:cupin domain-containing protein [Hyphomicrobiales bacterium]MCP5001981.1 cupin domain-containing protein [Hyphomicrobiales bacterium]
MDVVNLRAELAKVSEYWSPRILGRVNDQYIKVAKLKGEFVWHNHEGEDELFYIVKGSLEIQYEDGSVHLSEGDFHIVPKGKMHNPVAVEECWIALIEPVSTKHTGDVISDRTKSLEEQAGTG